MDDLVTQEFITAQYDLIDKAREFFENETKAYKFFENETKAYTWLLTPSSGLQQRVPIDNPEDGLQLLGRLEHGVFG